MSDVASTEATSVAELGTAPAAPKASEDSSSTLTTGAREPTTGDKRKASAEPEEAAETVALPTSVSDVTIAAEGLVDKASAAATSIATEIQEKVLGGDNAEDGHKNGVEAVGEVKESGDAGTGGVEEAKKVEESAPAEGDKVATGETLPEEPKGQKKAGKKAPVAKKAKVEPPARAPSTRSTRSSAKLD